MAQYCDYNVKDFEASGAIAQYARVKLVSGQLAVAAAADEAIGTIEVAAFAAGDTVPVRLRTAAGTRKMIAAAAITAGADVYTDASGEVGNTNTNTKVGIALQAASGAGSIIEVLPFANM